MSSSPAREPPAGPRIGRGFTLVELMIVVAIIAILAAIAYPGYRGFVMRGNRSDAQSVLMRIAQNMERYYTINNTYAGATLSSSPPSATDVWGTTTSPEGFYALSFAVAPTATAFTLRATAQGTQVQDTACAVMTLNERGQKLPAACW